MRLDAPLPDHAGMAAARDRTDLTRDPFPLRGRSALVTGVSRRQGIGFVIASRMAAWGASVFLHHMFPFGRWGGPDDPARLITWLCTDEARSITGQLIESEGGFARYRQR